MVKCAFGKGSGITNDKGEKIADHAPEKCKQAIWDKYKQVIEQCEIIHEHACPLKAFIPDERPTK